MARRFTRKLARLFDQQQGLCYYCDGRTWLLGRESKQNARERLLIPAGPHAEKVLRDATATTEHLLRRIDGGTDAKHNLKMACQSCNSRRGATSAAKHRIDMQVLVAAGLHPVNRPPVIDCLKEHRRRGLRALDLLRRGLFDPKGKTP